MRVRDKRKDSRYGRWPLNSADEQGHCRRLGALESQEANKRPGCERRKRRPKDVSRWGLDEGVVVGMMLAAWGAQSTLKSFSRPHTSPNSACRRSELADGSSVSRRCEGLVRDGSTDLKIGDLAVGVKLNCVHVYLKNHSACDIVDYFYSCHCAWLIFELTNQVTTAA